MPNLVGIGLSQVPTNSMLGGLAYQSPDHASIKDLDLKNLSQINSEIAGTAVDIFIYDTSKDSDGGAWRKRTTHTSWYNETLGTTTRGTRREFPAVAVIVATATKVTIYDGDDPDLPMWMVFPTTGYISWASGTGPIISSVSMLNAILVVGTSDSKGNTISDFIKDDTRYYYDSAYYNPTDRTIRGRNVVVNAATAYIAGGDGYVIVNAYINDVAMTVLPNAPIDETTGLPIPTIAVGTNAGTSIIKDDGTVVDIGVRDATTVDFTDDHNIIIGLDYYGNGYLGPIPSADIGDTTYRTNYIWFQPGGGGNITHLGPDSIGDEVYVNKKALYSNEGLSFYDADLVGFTTASSMVAYATTSYNTGWMHGDIKGAFLSDTDATNVSVSELVTNGSSGFSGTSGWYLDDTNKDTGTIATIAESSGSLVFTHSDTNNYWDGFGVSITTVVGKSYIISADIAVSTDMNSIRITNTASQHDTSPYNPGGFNSAGLHYYTFIATATTTYIHWNGYASTATMTLDSFSVRIADPDRSVNNNGLQVFGTITKSAVATGAELVAYSGFSTSNYLLQPPNSDLAFGNNAFSVMCWFKTSQDHSATDSAILIAGDDGSNQMFDLRVHSDEKLLWQATDDAYTSRSRIYQAGPSVDDGVWHCVVGTRTSDNKTHLYLDGNLIGSSTSESAEANLSNSIAFSIGIENAYDGTKQKPWGGSIALARISESVPSPEQIKKIYEDEKVLFQENAACTLYGSSDAVTALAYDEVTDRLHVGTSSGRSDFQGLRRINNTTTAVTTAISAHDEFIVEQ